MEYRLSKFINKVDFARNPSMIPNTDEGNLKLYYEFSLVRDSYEIKSKDIEDGINEPMENHVVYYMALVNEMEKRGLKVTRRDRSSIEKSISKSMKEAIISSYVTLQFPNRGINVVYCPHCGNKLNEVDLETRVCGECHGRLPGWGLEHGAVMKPFGHWEDFAACVQEMMRREGYNQETAERVCGKLRHDLEKISSTMLYTKS